MGVVLLSACHVAPAPQHAAPAGGETPAPSSPAAAATPASAAVTLAPRSELLALDLNTRVGHYAARDAVWAGELPVVVNRPFDFAMALALDAAGAGLAVAKRRRENEALAQQLRGQPPFDAEALAREICAGRVGGCPRLAAQPARVYALLFGTQAARLRVIVEPAAAENAAPCASLSDARPLQAFEAGAALHAAFKTELERALALFEAPAAAPQALLGQCVAGDGLVVSGNVVTRDAAQVVLAASDPNTLLRCPADAFSETPPAPGAPP